MKCASERTTTANELCCICCLFLPIFCFSWGGWGGYHVCLLTLSGRHVSLDSCPKKTNHTPLTHLCVFAQSHLCDVATDCLGLKSPDLLRDFKDLLARRSGDATVAADMSNHARPLAEIDFHACERITPTYRKLPADYFDPSYASRRPEEAQFLCDHLVSKREKEKGAIAPPPHETRYSAAVASRDHLNLHAISWHCLLKAFLFTAHFLSLSFRHTHPFDCVPCHAFTWQVSVALGAEDAGAVGTFKHMRKNEHEEKLFKTEDERFEVDMLIDSTKTAVAALQKLQIEIDALALLASGDGGITLAPMDRDSGINNSNGSGQASNAALSSTPSAAAAAVLPVASLSNSSASVSSSEDAASTFHGYEVEELCGGGLKNAVHYKLDASALNTVG